MGALYAMNLGFGILIYLGVLGGLEAWEWIILSPYVYFAIALIYSLLYYAKAFYW